MTEFVYLDIYNPKVKTIFQTRKVISWKIDNKTTINGNNSLIAIEHTNPE